MLGVTPEELLRRVRRRDTAGLTAAETARYLRLTAYGAARASKRVAADREADQIWKDAEERLLAEIEAREAQRKAEVNAKAAAKVATDAEKKKRTSSWW